MLGLGGTQVLQKLGFYIKKDILRLIFTIRSKRSRFEAHLQKTVKKSKKEQILRPIYKNGRGVDFEAHLKKRGSYLK